MKKQNKTSKKLGQNKLGFSLIELSIVILVIGILVIGITKGGAIMNKAKVSSAQTVSQSSPVNFTNNLVAWYEPVSVSSFDPDQALDGVTITVWNDNSPRGNLDASSDDSATYTEASINGLPAITFSGDDQFEFSSNAFNQRQYTFFVVERRSADNDIRFLNIGDNTFGYTNGTTLGSSANNATSTVSAFVAGRLAPRISTFVSDSVSRRVYNNGVAGDSSVPGTGTEDTTALNEVLTTTTAVDNINIGNNSYNGDIAEVILFNRGLKVTERNEIQEYLSKKYGISVVASTN
jgi:prepilin-type N-terminal cleavage/methylation domain-containing protein